MTNSYLTIIRHTPLINNSYSVRSFFETTVDSMKALEIFKYLFSESVKNFREQFPQFSHISESTLSIEITLLKSV